MLGGGAALWTVALGGCSVGGEDGRPSGITGAIPPYFRVAPLAPVKASVGRIINITVCTRPFRATGPRLDVEQIGPCTVVHNYGHGGSGWSLSWGSSTIAVRNALATGSRDIAVIGCGALGMTSAILLQRAGARATIYAKDRPPDVRSSLATGVWSPDSRICLEEHATAAFKQSWEEMRGISFRTYQSFLGVPGDPVEWIDTYALSDGPSGRLWMPSGTGPTVKFARLGDGDLVPSADDLPPGTHPFPTRHARRIPTMMFNLTHYSRLLISDFLANGGQIITQEFHDPAELSRLPQRTVINATGYGARALFGDDTLVPVRGQLARLVPQPEVRYGLIYDNVSLVPRRDGPVVQAFGPDEGFGFGDESTIPDRAEANQAVETIARLFARTTTA
jgi:hypothetical protein